MGPKGDKHVLKGIQMPSQGESIGQRKGDNADDSVRFVDDDGRAEVSEIACQAKRT